MRVKAWAVIMIDGQLIVAKQRRGGRTEHSPAVGGRCTTRSQVTPIFDRYLYAVYAT
jgi:hypothetical protein